MTMLRVRDMTVRFGGIVALDGISLDLNRGEILGLIGPNGAGKTTLFNCISGVIAPDKGTIFFEGHSLVYAPPHVRARFGIARTFQNLQLWGSMTVAENLVVPMDALGRRNTFSDALHLPFSSYAERASMERARAILHVLDLDRYRNTLAGDLPAGIQRRVEIARALAMRPRLLLLDEPAAGLDAQETAHLAELLHAVRERFHVSMLLVDHDMSLVMRVCDFVYVLDFGKLLARGRPAAIRNDPKVVAAYLGEESKKLTGDVIPVSNSAGHEADMAPAFQLFPRLRERRRQLVGTLSGGEQQMVALARAILSEPRLVMIDEMSQGLAPTVVRQLFEIVRVFREQGIAVLLVEQFVESALDVADRAYVFEHGTIGHTGPAVELRSDRTLVTGSYLGTAADASTIAAANGNGHHIDPALMEVMSVRVPAKVKRALEQRAENEGRPAGAVVVELLGKVDDQ